MVQRNRVYRRRPERPRSPNIAMLQCGIRLLRTPSHSTPAGTPFRSSKCHAVFQIISYRPTLRYVMWTVPSGDRRSTSTMLPGPAPSHLAMASMLSMRQYSVFCPVAATLPISPRCLVVCALELIRGRSPDTAAGPQKNFQYGRVLYWKGIVSSWM